MILLYLWRDQLQFPTVKRALIWQSGQRRFMPPTERWQIIYRGTSVGCMN